MSKQKEEKPMDGYKQKLLAAKQMMGQSGLAIYDRLLLLVEVYNDKDFRTDHGNIDDFKAAEIMDGYFSDLFGLGFLQLRSMLEHYPERKQWETGRLRIMWNDILKTKQAADAKVNERKPVKVAVRERVSAKDHHEIVQQYAQAEAKAETAQREAVAAKTELETLRAENIVLKEENRRLTMQVESLMVQLRVARANSQVYSAA